MRASSTNERKQEKEKEGNKRKSSFILMYMNQKFASLLDDHLAQRQ
jgi:hypothetical protein